MALCPECRAYPEGTACAMLGCPGRAFRTPEATGSRLDTAGGSDPQHAAPGALSEPPFHSETDSAGA